MADIIQALTQGGDNSLDNLRTLCQSCNTKQSWAYRERQIGVGYTTYLRPETIRTIKREAVESERKDYEIVQEALNRYFKANNRKQQE